MKRMILASTVALALLFAAGAPVADALAATKKRTCSCKPRLHSKSRRAVSKSAFSQNGTSSASVGPVYATYTLDSNQYFRLRMNQTLNSDLSHVGDRFTSTVVTPVYAGGVEVVPAGSLVEGRVTSVKSSRTRGREGQIAVAFDSLVLPTGKKLALDGALTELQGDASSSSVDGENEVSGRSSDKRNVAYIGGGTAGGALLGGIIGGGKGAGIGAAIGAGAGVAGVMLSKGNKAELKRGTEVGMTTTRPITFKVRSDR